MTIRRTIDPRVRAAAKRSPIVTLTGPRQSGKTTLAKQVFAHKPYVSLEDPDRRGFATEDPRGFLAQYPAGAVLDEVQRAPELVSYLQTDVDSHPTPGRWVLTGSQNFALLARLSQSLAGRAALLTLLPLSLEETRRFGRESPRTLETALWKGGYPAIYQRRTPPTDWLPDYIATYVERDVRQLLEVADLGRFQTFLRLVAGRSGQLLNVAALGADAGVSQPTAKRWLDVLEASYLVVRLQPWSENVTSRLVKAPKLHFIDSGLTCSLLGIRSAEELTNHPLRGSIFESWGIAEILKWRTHRGLREPVYFYRDRKGVEVDLLLPTGKDLMGVELKSGKTWASDFTQAMDGAARQLKRSLGQRVLYGGDDSFTRAGVTAISWRAIHDRSWG